MAFRRSFINVALDIEMSKQGLAFSLEHEMEISYKGVKIGTRRVDFFVETEGDGRDQGCRSTRGCSFGRKPLTTWMLMGWKWVCF